MESKCPICFDELENKVTACPDACDHKFCLTCLEQWSKLGSYCPVDRKRFRKIINLESGSKIEIKKRKRKRTKILYDFSVKCEVCSNDRSPEILLLCDCCDLGFHLSCLTPPLKSIPAGLWLCPDCVHVEQNLRLSSRSRRLLLKCKSTVAIRLKKLTSDELQMWLSKKSSIAQSINIDCIQEKPIVLDFDSKTTTDNGSSSSLEPNTTSSPLKNDSDNSSVHQPVQNKIVNFKGVLNKARKSLSSKSEKLFSHTKSFTSATNNLAKCYSVASRIDRQNNQLLKHGSLKYNECYVKMDNVLERICKCLGEYYVQETSIKIPLFSNYLSLLHPQAYFMNFILDIDAHMCSARRILADRKMKSNFQKSIFICHGCGLDQKFNDEAEVKIYSIEHLTKFHSVAAPELFLSVLRNDSYVIVEAFTCFLYSHAMGMDLIRSLIMEY